MIVTLKAKIGSQCTSKGVLFVQPSQGSVKKPLSRGILSSPVPQLFYDPVTVCLQEALQHIPAMLESLGVCARFPEDSCNFALTAQDATEAVAAEEETAAVLDKRQDLFTLFKNTAKLVPEPAYLFVRKQLHSVMSRQKAEWQVRNTFP